MLPLVIGATALGAASFAGYHSMAWRSQLYGRTFVGIPGQGRKLALTYDDGPNDPDTLLLLDVLARHNVKATFFLIGKFVEQRPDIVHKIADAGHAIGNHTYSHPNLLFSPDAELRKQLASCANALEKIGHSLSSDGTRLFRPPWGARRPATLRIARELGYTPVMWTVTCYDWKKTTADRVERHALNQIIGGDVILMHDGGYHQMGTDRRHTVEATDRIIGKYKAEGFEFVTVPEMMKSKA